MLISVLVLLRFRCWCVNHVWQTLVLTCHADCWNKVLFLGMSSVSFEILILSAVVKLGQKDCFNPRSGKWKWKMRFWKKMARFFNIRPTRPLDRSWYRYRSYYRLMNLEYAYSVLAFRYIIVAVAADVWDTLLKEAKTKNLPTLTKDQNFRIYSISICPRTIS